jgi:hypothetical protein
MKPGVTNLPVASTTRAPPGTFTDARGPTAAMRFPRTTIVASGTAGPPLPSINVAPTMATTVSAVRVEVCAPTAAEKTTAALAAHVIDLKMLIAFILGVVTQ